MTARSAGGPADTIHVRLLEPGQVGTDLHGEQVLLRNGLFTGVVLAHGGRRLLPPY